MAIFEAFLTDLAVGVGRLFIGSLVSLIFIIFAKGLYKCSFYVYFCLNTFSFVS